MKQTILVVEDEKEIADTLTYALASEGFSPIWAPSVQAAQTAFSEQEVNLGIFDVGLPDGNGFELLKHIRQTGNQMPVIFLTARSEEIDRIVGLEIGADDYVVKPFSPREVVARVKAVLRRATDTLVPTDTGTDFELNENSATLRIGDKECSLTSVELNLLKILYENPGRIFNRDQIMTRIYNDNRIVSDRTIDSHVKKLRQKIEALKPEEQYIHSVYGIGYKFEMS